MQEISKWEGSILEEMVVVTELLYETDCLFFIEGRGRLSPRHLYHKWSSK